MCSKRFSIFLTICLANLIRCSQIDFCMFGLSSSVNSFAYLIDDRRLNEYQKIFESMLREDKVADQFRQVFGESMDAVKSFNWYYNFGSLGRINITEILPMSVHCMFVYDRELFTERYNQPIVTAEEVVKFLFSSVIYQAEKEVPTHVRLPLIEMSEQQAVGCNFAKASSDHDEYIFAHCVQDGKTSADPTWDSTKIIQKSTRNEICLSDVRGVCGTTPEKMVDAKITINANDENDLNKLFSAMNCINCTIIMNVHRTS